MSATGGGAAAGDASSHTPERLFVALASGDEAYVNTYLAWARDNHGSLDMSLGSEFGHATALSVACGLAHVGIVRSLLSAGASADFVAAESPTQATPLHCVIASVDGRAAEGPATRIIRLLLEAGASVDTPDKQGCTPLLAAARAQSKALVELLLQHGANPLLPDEAGVTPLHGCASNSEVLAVLLPVAVRKNDACMFIQDSAGRSPMDVAADMNAAASVSAMLQATPRADTWQLQSVLHRLAAVGCLTESVYRELTDKSRIPTFLDTQGSAGRTAIETAQSLGHYACVQALLAAGAQPRDKDAVLAWVAQQQAAEQPGRGRVMATPPRGSPAARPRPTPSTARPAPRYNAITSAPTQVAAASERELHEAGAIKVLGRFFVMSAARHKLAALRQLAQQSIELTITTPSGQSARITVTAGATLADVRARFSEWGASAGLFGHSTRAALMASHCRHVNGQQHFVFLGSRNRPIRRTQEPWAVLLNFLSVVPRNLSDMPERARTQALASRMSNSPVHVDGPARSVLVPAVRVQRSACAPVATAPISRLQVAVLHRLATRKRLSACMIVRVVLRAQRVTIARVTVPVGITLAQLRGFLARLHPRVQLETATGCRQAIPVDSAPWAPSTLQLMQSTVNNAGTRHWAVISAADEEHLRVTDIASIARTSRSFQATQFAIPYLAVYAHSASIAAAMQELSTEVAAAAAACDSNSVSDLAPLASLCFSAADDLGRTPLHAAAQAGASACANHILNAVHDPEHVSQIHDASGRTPLHIAAAVGAVGVVSAILSHGGSVNALDSVGRTALHAAAEAGFDHMNLKLVPCIVDGLPRILYHRFVNEFEPTAAGNRSQVICNLLDAGIDASAQSDTHPSMYQLIPSCGGVDWWSVFSLPTPAVALTVLAKADPAMLTATDSMGRIALHYAANGGESYLPVVQTILSRPLPPAQHAAMMNAQDSAGSTPLHIAVSSGCASIVSALLAAGASPDVADHSNAVPLALALATGCSNAAMRAVTTALLGSFASTSPIRSVSGESNVVIVACVAGVSTAILDALLPRMDVAVLPVIMPLALQAVVVGGQKCAHLLPRVLAPGYRPPVHALAKALFLAISNRNYAACEALVSAGVPPAMVDMKNYGWSPLHAAAMTGDARIIMALLRVCRGSDLDITTVCTVPAAHNPRLSSVASSSGAPEMPALVRRMSSTIGAVSQTQLQSTVCVGDEVTPLAIAAARNHATAVKLLVQAGASVHLGSPIVYAAVSGASAAVLELLAAAGALGNPEPVAVRMTMSRKSTAAATLQPAIQTWESVAAHACSGRHGALVNFKGTHVLVVAPCDMATVLTAPARAPDAAFACPQDVCTLVGSAATLRHLTDLLVSGLSPARSPTRSATRTGDSADGKGDDEAATEAAAAVEIEQMVVFPRLLVLTGAPHEQVLRWIYNSTPAMLAPPYPRLAEVLHAATAAGGAQLVEQLLEPAAGSWDGDVPVLTLEELRQVLCAASKCASSAGVSIIQCVCQHAIHWLRAGSMTVENLQEAVTAAVARCSDYGIMYTCAKFGATLTALPSQSVHGAARSLLVVRSIIACPSTMPLLCHLADRGFVEAAEEFLSAGIWDAKAADADGHDLAWYAAKLGNVRLLNAAMTAGAAVTADTLLAAMKAPNARTADSICALLLPHISEAVDVSAALAAGARSNYSAAVHRVLAPVLATSDSVLKLTCVVPAIAAALDAKNGDLAAALHAQILAQNIVVSNDTRTLPAESAAVVQAVRLEQWGLAVFLLQQSMQLPASHALGALVRRGYGKDVCDALTTFDDWSHATYLLSAAIQANDLPVCCKLLLHDADIKRVQISTARLMNQLKACNATVDVQVQLPLNFFERTCVAGDLEVAAGMIAAGADCWRSSQDEATGVTYVPATHAALGGHFELVDLLLNHPDAAAGLTNEVGVTLLTAVVVGRNCSGSTYSYQMLKWVHGRSRDPTQLISTVTAEALPASAAVVAQKIWAVLDANCGRARDMRASAALRRLVSNTVDAAICCGDVEMLNILSSMFGVTICEMHFSACATAIDRCTGKFKSTLHPLQHRYWATLQACAPKFKGTLEPSVCEQLGSLLVKCQALWSPVTVAILTSELGPLIPELAFRALVRVAVRTSVQGSVEQRQRAQLAVRFWIESPPAEARKLSHDTLVDDTTMLSTFCALHGAKVILEWLLQHEANPQRIALTSVSVPSTVPSWLVEMLHLESWTLVTCAAWSGDAECLSYLLGPTVPRDVVPVFACRASLAAWHTMEKRYPHVWDIVHYELTAGRCALHNGNKALAAYLLPLHVVQQHGAVDEIIADAARYGMEELVQQLSTVATDVSLESAGMASFAHPDVLSDSAGGWFSVCMAEGAAAGMMVPRSVPEWAQEQGFASFREHAVLKVLENRQLGGAVMLSTGLGLACLPAETWHPTHDELRNLHGILVAHRGDVHSYTQFDTAGGIEQLLGSVLAKVGLSSCTTCTTWMLNWMESLVEPDVLRGALGAIPDMSESILLLAGRRQHGLLAALAKAGVRYTVDHANAHTPVSFAIMGGDVATLLTVYMLYEDPALWVQHCLDVLSCLANQDSVGSLLLSMLLTRVVRLEPSGELTPAVWAAAAVAESGCLSVLQAVWLQLSQQAAVYSSVGLPSGCFTDLMDQLEAYTHAVSRQLSSTVGPLNWAESAEAAVAAYCGINPSADVDNKTDPLAQLQRLVLRCLLLTSQVLPAIASAASTPDVDWSPRSCEVIPKDLLALLQAHVSSRDIIVRAATGVDRVEGAQNSSVVVSLSLSATSQNAEVAAGLSLSSAEITAMLTPLVDEIQVAFHALHQVVAGWAAIEGNSAPELPAVALDADDLCTNGGIDAAQRLCLWLCQHGTANWLLERLRQAADVLKDTEAPEQKDIELALYGLQQGAVVYLTTQSMAGRCAGDGRGTLFTVFINEDTGYPVWQVRLPSAVAKLFRDVSVVDAGTNLPRAWREVVRTIDSDEDAATFDADNAATEQHEPEQKTALDEPSPADVSTVEELVRMLGFRYACIDAPFSNALVLEPLLQVWPSIAGCKWQCGSGWPYSSGLSSPGRSAPSVLQLTAAQVLGAVARSAVSTVLRIREHGLGPAVIPEGKVVLELVQVSDAAGVAQAGPKQHELVVVDLDGVHVRLPYQVRGSANSDRQTMFTVLPTEIEWDRLVKAAAWHRITNHVTSTFIPQLSYRLGHALPHASVSCELPGVNGLELDGRDAASPAFNILHVTEDGVLMRVVDLLLEFTRMCDATVRGQLSALRRVQHVPEWPTPVQDGIAAKFVDGVLTIHAASRHVHKNMALLCHRIFGVLATALQLPASLERLPFASASQMLRRYGKAVHHETPGRFTVFGAVELRNYLGIRTRLDCSGVEAHSSAGLLTYPLTELPDHTGVFVFGVTHDFADGETISLSVACSSVCVGNSPLRLNVKRAVHDLQSLLCCVGVPGDSPSCSRVSWRQQWSNILPHIPDFRDRRVNIYEGSRARRHWSSGGNMQLQTVCHHCGVRCKTLSLEKELDGKPPLVPENICKRAMPWSRPTKYGVLVKRGTSGWGLAEGYGLRFSTVAGQKFTLYLVARDTQGRNTLPEQPPIVTCKIRTRVVTATISSPALGVFQADFEGEDMYFQDAADAATSVLVKLSAQHSGAEVCKLELLAGPLAGTKSEVMLNSFDGTTVAGQLQVQQVNARDRMGCPITDRSQLKEMQVLIRVQYLQASAEGSEETKGDGAEAAAAADIPKPATRTFKGQPSNNSRWPIPVTIAGIYCIRVYINDEEVANSPQYVTTTLVSLDTKIQQLRDYLATLITSSMVRLSVQREKLVAHAFSRLESADTTQLRGRLQIQFLNEPAIDAGGPTREWFQLLATSVVDESNGLFEMDPSSGDRLYHVKPHASEHQLKLLEALGKLLGKALFDNRLLPLGLSLSIFQHFIGGDFGLEDLAKHDVSLYRSLKELKHMTTAEEVDALCLDFTSSTRDAQGNVVSVDLIPDGNNIPVTLETRDRYVALMAKWQMYGRIAPEMDALRRGFHVVVPQSAVSTFQASELAGLVCGRSGDLGFIRRVTQYQDPYNAESPQIQWMWEVLEEGGEALLKSFLQFVTGCANHPVPSRHSAQTYMIRVYPGTVLESLPVASTCFQQLRLPKYPSKEELKHKLVWAVTEGNQAFAFS